MNPAHPENQPSPADVTTSPVSGSNLNGSQGQPHAAWVKASMLALVLLVGSGAAYRYLRATCVYTADVSILDPGTLNRLPMTLGAWQGTNRSMDEWLVRMTATTDRLSRFYTRGRTAGVALFIGYGPRPRDLLPHRPEVCYPVAGWAKEDQQEIKLTLDDGSTIPCRLYHFRRSGLRFERIAVLNWWMVDGEHFADISHFRWRVLSARAASPFVIQIQLARVIQSDPRQADAELYDLGREVAPAIRELLAKVMITRTQTMESDD